MASQSAHANAIPRAGRCLACSGQQSGQMDARKTREPVSDHPIPSPATLPQQQSMQAINEALDEVLLSTPPKHQPPPQSASESETDEDTDMSTDTAQSETDEVPPPPTYKDTNWGAISVMVGVTVMVIGGGGSGNWGGGFCDELGVDVGLDMGMGMGDKLRRMGRKEKKERKEQDKIERFYLERGWVDFSKRKVHVGTTAAALGNNLAASWLTIATRVEQLEVIDWTGKGNLQSWRAKLDDTVDPTCRSCRRHVETGKHVALVCPRGEEIRRRWGNWEEMDEPRRWLKKVKDGGDEYMVDLVETFFSNLDLV
ncbi:hypothetical protein EV426DRAFT_645802 [Tirmania nivea]|nr:hypothetical protein EV426DRAFT_645802 [Tirmania nivea]